jgi:peptide/nickel transport system substrate-binding protein
MRSTKKFTALFLCVLMLFSAAFGCAKQETETTDSNTTTPADGATATPASYQKEIVIASNAIIGKLDPQSNNTMVNKTVYYSLFSTLFDYNPVTKEFYGDLVDTYTVDPAGLVWKLKLHDNVKFHDGGKLTANDVKFTYERARDSSFQKSKVAIISNINVVDDYNLEITLSSPSQEFLEVLADPGMSILSQAAVTADPEKGISIGSGAFKLEELVPEDYCTLVRFDDYFGELPKTERLKFRKIAEDSARVIALQAGEIDVCLNPSSVDLPHISEDKNLQLIQTRGSRMIYWALNQSKAPFDNPLVRQAVACAINRDDIITVTVNGMGEPATHVISWSCSISPEDVTGYSYDPEKAKSLLAEAGYADGLSITIMLDSAQWKAAAEVLQSQLDQIGIKSEIEVLESAVASDKIESNDYECLFSSYGWSSSDDSALRSLFFSSGAYNESKLNSPEIDALIDGALVELDPAKRLDMYRQIDQTIMDGAYWLPVFFADLNVAIKNGVSGVNWAYHGRHDFTNIYLEK